MASTQTWTEGNGASAGTTTTSRAECNWKRIDDSTTAYTSSPINSSNNENSMTKYQCIAFAGTWNSISALTYKIDNNAPAAGLSIVGAVVTSGTTPATTASGDSALSTTGLSANLTTTAMGYAAGASSSTASGSINGNALRSQLQTTSSYAGGPGDITSRTITASWTES
jgi:hypothetical protein